MTTAPHFSIVVPHRNDLRGLARSLLALAGIATGRHRIEIIVVENCSIYGPEAVERLVATCAPLARVVTQVEPGAGPARNLGAALAAGRYLVFLDCDCVPMPDWLDRLTDALEYNDVVGGPMYVEIGASSAGSATSVELFDLLFGFQSKRSFVRDGLLLSGNLAMRPAVFKDVGPFRTNTSEDRDWCVRARRAGHRLALCPQSYVSHRAIDDEGALLRRWMRITRESFVFYSEQGFSRARWLAYCLVVAVSPFAHGLRVLTDARLQGVSATSRLAVIRLLLACRLRRSVLGLRLLFALDSE